MISSGVSVLPAVPPPCVLNTTLSDESAGLVPQSGRGAAGDLEVMVARISGILSGVVISLTTAVLLLPQSATHRALEGIKHSLVALVRLSESAWWAAQEPRGSHQWHSPFALCHKR